MVKTPTYPLAAFNYVTLCSFKVYRQITRGHLLWHSREISDLKQWDFSLEGVIPRPTATPPYDPSSDFVVQRGSRFTPFRFVGGGPQVSGFLSSILWRSCMTWPIKQLRVEFAVVLHEAGGWPSMQVMTRSRGFPWCPIVFDPWFPPLFGSVEPWSLDIFRRVWRHMRCWHSGTCIEQRHEPVKWDEWWRVTGQTCSSQARKALNTFWQPWLLLGVRVAGDICDSKIPRLEGFWVGRLKSS